MTAPNGQANGFALDSPTVLIVATAVPDAPIVPHLHRLSLDQTKELAAQSGGFCATCIEECGDYGGWMKSSGNSRGGDGSDVRLDKTDGGGDRMEFVVFTYAGAR